MLSRNSRGERRASPSQYKVLLTSHLIVSVGWLGAAFAKLVLGLVAVTTDVPENARNLYVAVEVLNVAFPPLAISTIISGVLLSVGTRWGLLEHSWVVTKLMLTVGVITTAIQFDGRLAQQAMAALSALTVDDGTILGIASTPSSLLLALVLAHVLMLGTATVLSVYKPWGRTWFARCQAVPAWIDCPVSARARATPTHEPASQG